MTNTVDAMKPTYWSNRTQANLRVKNIARQITSNEEQANLFDGKQVNRPTVSRASIGTVGADGSFTSTPVTSTQESLIIDGHQYASFSLTDAEMKQLKNSPRLVNEMIDDGAYQLNLALDRSVFSEYSNSANAVTATGLTAGRLTNVAYDNLQDCHRVLRDAGVEQNREWYFLGDSYVTTDIQKEIGARVTQLGDKEQANGFGYFTDFAGFKVYEANQTLPFTAEVKIVATPSNGQTVVIDGVTFTFVSTIGSTAGNVLIGGSADAAAANFNALINAPSTTTANGVALATADAAKFVAQGQTLISATADAATDTVTITSSKGRIAISHTMAGTGNGVQNAYLHCPFGRQGAIDLVLQKDIETEMARQVSNNKLSTVYVTHFLWGKKMFTEGANRSGYLSILTQANDIS